MVTPHHLLLPNAQYTQLRVWTTGSWTGSQGGGAGGVLLSFGPESKKSQNYQKSLPGFILHAVTGTNMFYNWKPAKGPNTSALGLLIKSSQQLKYLENSFLTENAYYTAKIKHISLPKYRASSKLRFQNCYDTALPESRSILLPKIPLYKNNYISAEMCINICKSSLLILFHQTIP